MKPKMKDQMLLWFEREVTGNPAILGDPPFVTIRVYNKAEDKHPAHEVVDIVFREAEIPNNDLYPHVELVVWCSPVVSEEKNLISYVDMLVNMDYIVSQSYDRSTGSWFDPIVGTRQIAVLFYHSIASVMEVIRDIRYIEVYQDYEFAVVSPDTRWANVLKSQGIVFVQAPDDFAEGVI